MNNIKFILQNERVRVLLFATIWWILTNGVMESWWVGVPVVLLATSVSVVLLPPGSWSFMGIIRFIPFFLWRSLYGGADVAVRAMHPHLPIAPGKYTYPWRLPPGISRVFMANTVSLLPGTLSTELNNDCLLVHILDLTGRYSFELRRIEEHVADVFNLCLINKKAVN